MIEWKLKALTIIVTLGVLSLLFSFLSPAKSGTESVRLRKPLDASPSTWKDLLKLKSDPRRNRQGSRKDKRKQRIPKSIEPPRVASVDVATYPIQNELLQKKAHSDEARTPFLEVETDTSSKGEARTEIESVTLPKDRAPEAEPPEIAIMEVLELATDANPSIPTGKKTKQRKKQHKHNRNSTKTRPHPKAVSGLDQLEGLLTHRVSGTRLTPEGQIDWNYYDVIELYHTRKAGGTSLYAWAKMIGQKHGLDVHQQEGSCFDPRDRRYVNRKALIFTSLRPPVERALSSYEYDVVQMSNSENHTLREFYDHANEANNHGRNERNVWQYKSYIPPTKLKRKRRKKQGGVQVSRGWVWQCATDCYSKWFGGWPTDNLEADTITAVSRLDHLEVVWMKNLNDPNYVGWLLHRWNATDIPLPQKRVTADRAKHGYTEEEIELLNHANQKDQWLYEALRRKWSNITKMALA